MACVPWHCPTGRGARRHPAVGFSGIMADLGYLHFLQVIHRLELVLVLMRHHRVIWIGYGDVFLDFDPEPGVADGHGDADEVLHHHIHWKMIPLEKSAPEELLITATFGISTA